MNLGDSLKYIMSFIATKYKLVTATEREEAFTRYQGERVNRTPSSEAVDELRYDPTEKILEARYTDGSRYLYYNVPENAYETVINAGDVGKTFNTKIRWGFYPYKEIT
jgi:hypothetical protein